MRFEFVMVHNINDRTALGGRNIPDDSLTIAELEKIIETEQFLEKVLGKRVHINHVPDQMDKG